MDVSNSADVSTELSAVPENVANDDTQPAQFQDSPNQAEQDHGTSSPPSRPLQIYTKAQIIALHKSPLVSVPTGMPELKDWFGTENEQNLNRKDSEPTTPNSGRERRFRRDADDGAELPSRPSFRSAASQPSQMGNFKHQSMRSNDRDRDLDRDREGQERLRSLSDKFDRDRLSISGVRNKDRDLAPHFAAGSSRTTQQQGTIANRRAENREASKKKVGEASEDWRRGGDTRRIDRTENGRGEREDKERPRSRVRDSSRGRRDSSPSRRDRDDRRERDRDDNDDDPRRWRDDGKRDERMAARRERERGRDKPPHENPWESGGDRRWAIPEDRDVRAKKGAPREKRSTGAEEAREREKEKEPAWMDTYIPPSSGGGILGGKSTDGELDGIQAWKKNMKEKEQKAKAPKPTEAPSGLAVPESSEEPMDEIQQFKKMMQKAQKQRADSPPDAGPASASATKLPDSLVPDSVEVGKPLEATAPTKTNQSITTDPSRSLLSLLTPNDNARSTPQATQPSSGPTVPLKQTEPGSLTVDRSSGNPSPSPGGHSSPPQGSRLLALGGKAVAKQSLQSIPSDVVVAPYAQPIQKPSPSPLSALLGPQAESNPSSVKPPLRSATGFSPFDEQRELAESLRRSSSDRMNALAEGGMSMFDSSSLDYGGPAAGHPAGKGSRFAKFFDAKTKEGVAQPAIPPKATTPVGYSSTSPIPGPRQEAPLANSNGERTVEELFAKLNMGNQFQPQRSNIPPHSGGGNMAFSQQSQNNPHVLQHQQFQSQNPHLRTDPRLEQFIESRNFTPDGLVPGLRSVPPPRNRENGAMFNDPLDETVLLNQRMPLQQQRTMDQLYPGQLPTGFGQQTGRNVGIPVQQQQFRGGPSPTIPSQHISVHNNQQRLPPGLANLGGRPPHDPSQLLGIQGLGSQGLHGGLQHLNPQQHLGFNNFHPQNQNNVGFGGAQPQLRGPPPGGLQNVHHQLGGLGHPGSLDLRNPNQAQLLAMSGLGAGNAGGAGGGVGGGFNHLSSAQLQNPLLAQMRQQPQQQRPPPQMPQHMMPHMLPPHLPQQGPPMTGNSAAQDLMALLMGGVHHRE
ncbi:hypothetical protein Moror_114 [Moniliophthora roreri MCA 2997]|uniref:Uncharacterized protein n=1 Tax=Moniliophthora roreri (strain MCA 2997) TaxID=1381753 RepID=V2Z320_MONRO|nr:hypothetical protein Moror_114 [Moniliophthora roreri MCA 2997]